MSMCSLLLLTKILIIFDWQMFFTIYFILLRRIFISWSFRGRGRFVVVSWSFRGRGRFVVVSWDDSKQADRRFRSAWHVLQPLVLLPSALADG